MSRRGCKRATVSARLSRHREAAHRGCRRPRRCRGREAAPLLAYLRELQRRHGVAVLVVHHARKGAGNARAGEALRGSSEFHAWGDSNLYLRRDGDGNDAHRGRAVAVAHRHRACPAWARRSSTRPRRPRRARARSTSDRRGTCRSAPMPFAALRSSCRVRAATLYERLAALSDAGRVVKTDRSPRRQLITTPPTIRMTPAPSRRLAPLPGHHYSARERELGSPMDKSYSLQACPSNALDKQFIKLHDRA